MGNVMIFDGSAPEESGDVEEEKPAKEEGDNAKVETEAKPTEGSKSGFSSGLISKLASKAEDAKKNQLKFIEWTFITGIDKLTVNDSIFPGSSSRTKLFMNVKS